MSLGLKISYILKIPFQRNNQSQYRPTIYCFLNSAFQEHTSLKSKVPKPPFLLTIVSETYAKKISVCLYHRSQPAQHR